MEINGRDIAHMDTIALRRRMGYVIQQIGLFPHMTIRENIEIIARMKSKDRDRMEENAIRLMNMVNLDPATFMDAYPSEMSGGQQQRAGVVRAFMAEPEIILMDVARFRPGSHYQNPDSDGSHRHADGYEADDCVRNP